MAYQPPPDGSVPPGGASPPGGAFGAAPHVYGPSNAYGQPNAYGPPGAYGLAAYPQQGGGAAFASAASAAGSVVAFAGMSVGVAVFWRLLGLAGPSAPSDQRRSDSCRRA